MFFGFYWELQNQNVLYSPLGILIEDKLGVFYKAKRLINLCSKSYSVYTML